MSRLDLNRPARVRIIRDTLSERNNDAAAIVLNLGYPADADDRRTLDAVRVVSGRLRWHDQGQCANGDCPHDWWALASDCYDALREVDPEVGDAEEST